MGVRIEGGKRTNHNGLPLRWRTRSVGRRGARTRLKAVFAGGGRRCIANARNRRSAMDELDEDEAELGAIPAPEPAIPLCRQVAPLGHRCRATTHTIHCNRTLPAAILGKLIPCCYPKRERRET
jgi:hypothetical protein